MGWCSATDIFDNVCKSVLDSAIPEEEQYRVLYNLANQLENEDWDCQSDSDYYKHPLVKRIMIELHPDWFEDEDQESEG